MLKNLLARSLRSLEAFMIWLPALTAPLYTRTKWRRPTYLSVCTLKTSAVKGASSRGGRCSSFSVYGFIPFTGGMSLGLGRYETIASSTR